MTSELLTKYDVPAPRYTSYPTVPDWDVVVPEQDFWKEAVRKTFQETNSTVGISLYLHLPFCERLCTYCGCNTRITINHAVERVYMNAIHKEWNRYLTLFNEKPRIKEIHLGGGTPTFFSPENLSEMLRDILKDAIVAPDPEFSFEAHPGNTTIEHLRVLYELGFRRLSIGVQDFDPEVLHIINRFQTYEDVVSLTENARQMGYKSVNFDLVYGLPLQKQDRFMDTVKKVTQLQPDRIALYSYAHVPWVKPGQRKFSEVDLPAREEKLMLYQGALDWFTKNGYQSIGMDHFALPEDELSQAARNGTLHRNFMGYTVSRTKLLIGMGTSAISDAGTGYVQNQKVVETYYKALNEREFPFFKGHKLTKTDQAIRRHILQLMCSMKTSWDDEDEGVAFIYEGLERLRELEKDGLVVIKPYELWVTGLGQLFLRNICMALDPRIWSEVSQEQRFSKAL